MQKIRKILRVVSGKNALPTNYYQQHRSYRTSLTPVQQTTNRRRKLEEGLKSRRDKKLSSKLSMNTQLLNISKEELPLKRKLVEQLEKSEEEFNWGMNKVCKSMENISSCIQQTVGILAHLVNQQQTPYQQQYRPPFSSPSFNHQLVPQYGHPSQRNCPK